MSPREPGRSVTRSRVRAILGLVLVGLLAFPLIAASNRVEVNVDGEVVALRTYADTVADVLDDLEVELRHGDEVSHDLNAPLEEGMAISIARASTVDILVDGLFSHRIVAPVTSVAGALTAAGMEDVRETGADIVPPWTAQIESGAVIEVWTPQEVTVEVDGDQIQLASLVSDVDTFLTEQGIELGDDDIVSVSLETPLVFIDEIVIERVEFVEEVEEVVLEHATQRRETSQLDRGTTRVQTEGADGLREDTYEVKLIDGEEVERELIAEEIVTEPTTRVVLVGTRTPPPPPPPSSSSSGSRNVPSGVPSADDPVWSRLAQCESNGNWSAISRNGMYYGGLQFHPRTWRSVGGTGMPHEATRAEQIYRAQRLLAKPWATWNNQWPACSRMLGL